ncbi:MAG: S41 family peptidase [Pseudomonadota bacterium]
MPLKLLAATPLVLLLLACGGGGSGPTAPVATPPAPADTGTGVLASAASLAQQCAAPRAGTPDRQGSIDTEKSWVRSFMDETYLWYKDVPVVNAANYTLAGNGNSVLQTLNAYFQALKTRNTTASGKPVDQFSFTLSTVDLINQQSGIASGYGFRRSTLTTALPRVVRILYVEQGSPAQLAGVLRGDTITSIDGVDINDTTGLGIAALNAGLAPTVANKTTRFGLLAANASTPRFVDITSSQTIAVTPVALSSVITDGSNTVGYLVLNSFSVVSAEKQLVDAFTLFKNARVNELVVDLRYNGGGYLDLANELAWMIGDTTLAGKTFEKLSCNDKNLLPFCNTTSPFHQTTQGFSVAAGQPLPQLGLKRVFMLTSGSTCSASESVFNGLSPFMEVIRIGGTSCGKPYGFSYENNCGTSYAAMQFKGVNALGFGDYADGFAPHCAVADDLTRQRGDPAESMLSGALAYMRTGACPAPQSGNDKGVVQSLLQQGGHFAMDRSPSEAVRVLRGPSGR